MLKRLLIAVPIAAIVVAALFWAMRGFVPVGRAEVDYTVVLIAPYDDERGARLRLGPDCHDCGGWWIMPELPHPEANDADGARRLPDPPRPEPEKGESPAMPRERFPAPTEKPDPSAGSGWPEDPCAPYDGPIVRLQPIWPKEARDGDYAVVEYTATAEGRLEDIEIVETSNPKIRDDVIRIVRRWRLRPNCVDGQLVESEPRRGRVRIEFQAEDGERP